MTDLLHHLGGETGVILRRDAVAAGIDDNALRRHVRAGRLVRIRQGAYALSAIWAGASEEQQHLLRVDAVMRQYGKHVVLSHASAALAHGAPAWDWISPAFT